MEQFTFEKLTAWQKSRILVKQVYTIIEGFPQSERYGLSSQLARAIVSVPSNIAEGCGRPSLKERVHFYEIAYGSLMESYTQLLLASDLGMAEQAQVEALKPLFEEVAKLLSGLRRSLLEKLNH